MFWRRIIGKGDADTPSDEVIEAEREAQAAVSQRLGRLVSRQRDEAVAADATAQSSSKLGEYFADCAFFIVGAAQTANPAEIHRAVDDLSFAEEVDPAALAQAQAELLSPRDRLNHELAWLPGCDASFEGRVIAALKAGDTAALDALRFAAAGLARLNLGAGLMAGQSANEAAIRQQLTDFSRWDCIQTQALIDTARQPAGLRPVDPVHFDEAAALRRGALAEQLAEAAATTREGRAALAAAIDENSATIRAATNLALETVIAAYARSVDPRLQNLQAKIAEAIASLRSAPQQPAKLTSIITMLDLWTQFRQPLQRLEQARGLDDPLSAKLFGDLRDLGIELANTHNLQTETLRLARALRQAFAAVPGLQPILARDMPTLMGNVLSDQMIKLAEDAISNLRPFCEEIRSGGFDAGGGLRTGRLVDCFEQWREADPDGDQPFEVLHQIAIVVNNKASAPALAIQIIDWLNRQIPPPSISPRLNQTFCQLQQNIKNMR